MSQEPTALKESKIPVNYRVTQPQRDTVDSTNGEAALRLTQEQLAKLRSELDIVQENMTILNEMLTELTPGNEHPSDLELLSVGHRQYLIGKRFFPFTREE